MASHDGRPLHFQFANNAKTRTTIAKASDVQEGIVRLIGGLIEASGCINALRAIAIAVLWSDRFEPTERDVIAKPGRHSWIGEVRCPG
jgi:hypothetical protein